MTIRLGRKVKRERGCSFCLFPELTVCQAGNESGCVGLRCGVETAKQTQLSCGAACSVLGEDRTNDVLCFQIFIAQRGLFSNNSGDRR